MQADKYSIAVAEYADQNAAFSLRVAFENLTAEELADLLLALELREGLGHKIGLGKALGLGSCYITVDRQCSTLYQPEQRYCSWSSSVQAPTWPPVDPSRLPPALIEILRLNKPDDGFIGYPELADYPPEPIDMLGEFGGKATEYGRSGPFEAASETPAEHPLEGGTDDVLYEQEQPSVEPPSELLPEFKEGEPVWLKAIFADKLIFVTVEGKELERRINEFQGKKNELEVGHWYHTKGNRSVIPLKRRR